MKTKLLFLFILTLSSFSAHSQLVINEIMSNNVSAVMDDSYNYSMWVELYNSGSNSVNQNQYYFTDDLSQPRKWNPESKVIPAKGYSIIWFERDEIVGHTNFKLNPEGGNLYLINGNDEVVDKLTYPQQHRNASYGRINDGANNWVYFTEYSFGSSNNGKVSALKACSNPKFETKGGFYSGKVNVLFAIPAVGETIYYTLNGEEPTLQSTKYIPGNAIELSSTTCLRACTFANDKLPSEIVTATYFINERRFNLPVVSIVTEQKNLTDNTIGIYVKGTNGILRTCPDNVVANYNQDWDRPVNFEFFDDNGVSQINQEVDVQIAGGCSRGHAQKSLKISARKKFGENRLRYDFFSEAKPGRKYDGLLYRNSGNDFSYSMMRDGFMQTLIYGRMDVDGQAYLPTVCFINGEYYGIQNLRETSNHHNVYSNYGLDKEDINIIDDTEIGTDPEFQSMVKFARDNDINNPNIYAQVGEMIDIDSYLSYMIAQIYFNNGDWPHHNIKMWKKKEAGKWRPILFDTDFGYGLFGLPSNSSSTGNAILYALEETPKRENGYENIYMLRRLMQNDVFKKKFIDRFCIHISSTFETNRANHIIDSLRLRIEDEMVYHKQRFSGGSGFSGQISNMKSFSANRPQTVLKYIQDYFNLGSIVTVEIGSNITEANYQLFDENILDSNIALKYFSGQEVNITANPVKGYKFKHWETKATSSSVTSIATGDVWKYWDKFGVPAQNWNMLDYDDSSWKSGRAQLGWGGKGEATVISYGDDPNNKHTTAYFRKTVEITDVQKIASPKMKLYVDDGAVIYVNGTEIGRYNMPEGTVSFDTKALVFNNGVWVDFDVPVNVLKSGSNLIAVEVHQEKLTTSDAMFNLSFSYEAESESNSNIVEHVTYSTMLNDNISIKAVYEKSTEPIEPEEAYPVYINEIVASNSTHQDEYGEKDDYIEIYNGGEEPISLAGWYITDTPTVPSLYKFPNSEPDKTTIPAKGRIIVWADSQPEQGVLHANFSLNKSGEYVTLSTLDKSGNFITVDQVVFPELPKNMSYSRVPDGEGEWFIQEMTFNVPNKAETGIDKIDYAVNIKTYPTYVENSFVVENATGGEMIKLFDLTGNLILQKKITSEKETIFLPNLQQGIYVVQVGNKLFKIVKK